MNVSLEKSSFLKVVQGVQGALSNKSTLPVLNGILLEATNKTLSAHATDLEISIKNRVEADVKKEGRVVVFGNLLAELAKNLDDGKIDILFNDKTNKLSLKSNKSSFDLNTLPAEDYPAFPVVEDGTSITMEADDFTGGARQVAVATSRDESRPVLTGVYFSLDKKNTSLVATDSYRLSLKQLKTPKNNHSAKIVVPRRAVEEVIKTTPKGGTIRVILSDKQVAFEKENLLFVSRLIGGQYPNFAQLFPKKHEVEVSVDKEVLLQAAKRMATLSTAAPVVLRVKKENLTILSKNSDVGSGEETIPVKGGTKEVEVAFNPKYLIDGLGTIDDKEVVLQLTDSHQPGLMRGSTSKDFSYLIMPVRLN